MLEDPLAIDLVERIDYPFAERFGPTAGVVAQGQALRSLCFDQEIRRFMAAHPGGTVVALGEGLETAFQRTDDGLVRWLGVDLPETVAVREAVLGDEGPRHRSLASSALDVSWMDEVDADRRRADHRAGAADVPRGARRARAARRLRGDRSPAAPSSSTPRRRCSPRWRRRGALKTPGGFVAPPMPWGMDAGGRRALARSIPGIEAIDELPAPPRPRQRLERPRPDLHEAPVIGGWRLTVCRARFSPKGARPLS